MEQQTVVLETEFIFEVIEGLKRGSEALTALYFSALEAGHEEDALDFASCIKCTSIIGLALCGEIEAQCAEYVQKPDSWSSTFTAMAKTLEGRMDPTPVTGDDSETLT